LSVSDPLELDAASNKLILKIGKNETLGDWLDSLGERREGLMQYIQMHYKFSGQVGLISSIYLLLLLFAATQHPLLWLVTHTVTCIALTLCCYSMQVFAMNSYHLNVMRVILVSNWIGYICYCIDYVRKLSIKHKKQ